jgi:hypothetical protein
MIAASNEPNVIALHTATTISVLVLDTGAHRTASARSSQRGRTASQ